MFSTMNTGKKSVLHIGILGGVLIGFGIWFLAGNGVRIGSQENQDDIRFEIGIWTSETRIEQTFIASQNQLCRLDFAVKTYHPWSNPYLDCRLFEIQTGENPAQLSYEILARNVKEVRHKRLNGWLISGHMFNSFVFDPIADSRNKRYLFSIQAPGLKNNGGSILLASSEKRYESGNLFVNGQKQDRDLGFRALYAQPKIMLIQKSVARLALQKPFPFSKPVAYYVLFGMYLIMLIVLFWWL